MKKIIRLLTLVYGILPPDLTHVLVSVRQGKATAAFPRTRAPDETLAAYAHRYSKVMVILSKALPALQGASPVPPHVQGNYFIFGLTEPERSYLLLDHINPHLGGKPITFPLAQDLALQIRRQVELRNRDMIMYDVMSQVAPQLLSDKISTAKVDKATTGSSSQTAATSASRQSAAKPHRSETDGRYYAFFCTKHGANPSQPRHRRLPRAQGAGQQQGSQRPCSPASRHGHRAGSRHQ